MKGSFMKKLIITCLALIAATANTSAFAAITLNLNGYTDINSIKSWPVAYTDKSTANPSLFSQVESNFGTSSLYSLAQSWLATESGALTNIQIAVGDKTSVPSVSFNISVYEDTPPTTEDWSDILMGTYTLGTDVSNDLLVTQSNFTWIGCGGTNTAAVLEFALSGEDQVAITAGRTYIFEVSMTSNPSNNMIWYRDVSNAYNYTDGQAFRKRSPLTVGGTAPQYRDMTLAVTVSDPVPEPATMALLGLGSLVLFKKRST
jgi:hypothetical protein